MGLFGSKKPTGAQSAHAERLSEGQQRIADLPDAYPDGASIDKAQLADAYAVLLTYAYEIKCEQKNDARWIQAANFDARGLMALLDGIDFPNYGTFSALNRWGGSTIKNTLEDRISVGSATVVALSGGLYRRSHFTPEPFIHCLRVMSGACAHTLRTSGVGETFLNPRTMKALESV